MVPSPNITLIWLDYRLFVVTTSFKTPLKAWNTYSWSETSKRSARYILAWMGRLQFMNLTVETTTCWWTKLAFWRSSLGSSWSFESQGSRVRKIEFNRKIASPLPPHGLWKHHSVSTKCWMPPIQEGLFGNPHDEDIDGQWFSLVTKPELTVKVENDPLALTPTIRVFDVKFINKHTRGYGRYTRKHTHTQLVTQLTYICANHNKRNKELGQTKRNT